MAEISLKEYIDRVESLFQTGKFDEVVQHGRHILKFYHLNTPASRMLGRALVYTSEPQQAEMYLRRVLAVYPDDAVAHAALSEVNERLSKPNEAIWHMERALEQAPGVKGYMDKLRSLYQQHRNIDDPRFQLTTGAVARQYIRNGLYPQAIETLQATLDKSPKRMDLKLHLAQTQWEAGMHVEAAETALDILDVLPYCLGANHLLTRLWLAEGRPSDAQRYLNQIQEVEPYVALRLAQEGTPDNNAFVLPELDYRRIAETQLATNQPDWLSQVSAEDAVLDGAPTELEAELTDEDDFLTELGEEGNVLPPQAAGPGHSGLLMALDSEEDADFKALTGSDMPDWLAEAAPVEGANGDPDDELTWLETSDDAPVADLFADFDNLGDDATDLDADPLSWLAEDSEDEIAASDEAALDWMAETETVDSSELPDLFGTGGDDANPLAWMQDAGVELNDEQTAPDFFADADASDDLPQTDGMVEADPLAWMQDAGVEFNDEPGQSMRFAGAEIEDDIEFGDPAEIDPLGWMQDAGVELNDEPATADFFGDTEESPVTDNALEDDDSLAWMQDAGVELADEAPVPDFFADTDDSLDWMQTSGAEPVDDEAADSLEWLQSSNLTAPETTSPAINALPETPADAESLDWLSDESLLDEIIDLESLSAESPAPAAAAPQGQADDEIGWQDTMADENFPPTSDSGDSEEDLSSFEWLNDATEPEAEIPDWLAESPDEPQAADSAKSGPDWLTEAADDGEFAWLDETDAESTSEVAATNTTPDWLSTDDDKQPDAEPADMPDWLSDAAPLTELGNAEPAAEAELDWLSGDEEDDEQTAAESTGMPDWLSDAAPVTELGEAEPAAEVELDWLSGDEDEDEQPAAEPDAMPNWLSDAAPVAELGDAEPAAEIELDWLTDDDVEEPAAANTPDWLSTAEPAAETTSDTFDWLSGDEDAEDQPAAEPADMPDWLSDATPVTELGNAEPAADAELDWLSGDEDEDEQPAAESADMPDWLSDAAPVTELGDAEPAADAEPVAEIELNWLSDDEDEEDQPAAEPADMPDWLSDAAPVAEMSDAEPTAEAELDWLSGDEDEEDQPDAEPADMPDWLSDATPVTELGNAEPAAEAELDWLSDDEDEDEQPAAEPADMPDWLSDAASVAEAVNEDVEEDDRFEWPEENAQAISSELPAWLSEVETVSDDSEAEAEAEPVAETPDWLSEPPSMEDDIDEAIEAEPVPDWLSDSAHTSMDEPDEAEPVAETPDWLSEPPSMEDDIDEAIEAEPVPDWLSDNAPAAMIGQTRILDDDGPDWLADSEADDDEAVEQPAAMIGATRILSENFEWEDQDEPEYETDPSSSQFGWTDESTDEDEFTEQYEPIATDELESEQSLAAAAAPPPADNAPDWLNAMVPGLDLDYAAQDDDEPVETAYLEAPVVHRAQTEVPDAPQDINWLVDIVDEETGPFVPITEMPQPTRRRFTFSRKPAWLRMLTERLPQSKDQDDDFELPEWLQ